MENKKCLICQKIFTRVEKGKNFNYIKTCSRKCGSKLQKENAREKSNKYIIQGLTTKLIINGVETYIDTEDIEKINIYCWGIDGKGYVYKHKSKSFNKRESLHRFLLKPPKNKVIDHINHNPFDNCKDNLRIVSQSVNILSSKLCKRNQSGIKGVSIGYMGWRARIKIGKKTKEKHFKKKKDAISQRLIWEKELQIK